MDFPCPTFFLILGLKLEDYFFSFSKIACPREIRFVLTSHNHAW